MTESHIGIFLPYEKRNGSPLVWAWARVDILLSEKESLHLCSVLKRLWATVASILSFKVDAFATELGNIFRLCGTNWTFAGKLNMLLMISKSFLMRSRWWQTMSHWGILYIHPSFFLILVLSSAAGFLGRCISFQPRRWNKIFSSWLGTAGAVREII